MTRTMTGTGTRTRSACDSGGEDDKRDGAFDGAVCDRRSSLAMTTMGRLPLGYHRPPGMSSYAPYPRNAPRRMRRRWRWRRGGGAGGDRTGRREWGGLVVERPPSYAYAMRDVEERERNKQQATTTNEATEASGARGANVAIVPLLPPPACVTTTPTSTERGGGHPRRAVIAGAARPSAGGAVARGCCRWRPYPRSNYDLGGGAGAQREATTANEAIEEGRWRSASNDPGGAGGRGGGAGGARAAVAVTTHAMTRTTVGGGSYRSTIARVVGAAAILRSTLAREGWGGAGGRSTARQSRREDR